MMLGVSLSDYITYLLDPKVRSNVFSEIMNLGSCVAAKDRG